jgi:hypothetical protein
MNTHPTLLKHVWAKPDQDNDNLAQNPFILDTYWRFLSSMVMVLPHKMGESSQINCQKLYVFNNKKQFYWQTNHFNEYIRDKLSSSWARFLFRPATQRFFCTWCSTPARMHFERWNCHLHLGRVQ